MAFKTSLLKTALRWPLTFKAHITGLGDDNSPMDSSLEDNSSLDITLKNQNGKESEDSVNEEVKDNSNEDKLEEDISIPASPSDAMTMCRISGTQTCIQLKTGQRGFLHF